LPSDPNPGALVFAQLFHLTLAVFTCTQLARMEKYTEAFPVRVTAQMYKAVKAAADREYLSISQFIRKLIRDNVMKDDKK
jgi:predicted HicB family RNase H-like nuclease